MADNMLQFEEEAHLMEYEIGLDMYQRVREIHFAENKAGSSSGGTSSDVANSDEDLADEVVYNFQGEFWNDELDNYQVRLPNRCESAEEWDIFFK